MDNFDILRSDCVYSMEADESIQLERVTVILMKAVQGGNFLVYLRYEVQAEEGLRGLVLHESSASPLMSGCVSALALLNKVENDNK